MLTILYKYRVLQKLFFYFRKKYLYHLVYYTGTYNIGYNH